MTSNSTKEPDQQPHNRSEIVAVVLTAGVTLVAGPLTWWSTAIGLTLIFFLLGYHERLAGPIRRFELLAYAAVWGLSLVLVIAPLLPKSKANVEPKPVDDFRGFCVWLILSAIAFVVFYPLPSHSAIKSSLRD